LLPAIVLCLALTGCLRPTARRLTAPSAESTLALERNYRILDTATGLAYSGYRIARPGCHAELACNRGWGYYSLEVYLGGESLAYTRNFMITAGDGVAFTPQQDYRKDREKSFTFGEDGTAIHWRTALDGAAPADYRGAFRFEPNRFELVAEWTPRAGLSGLVVPACLHLGLPLVRDCAYRAVLADGAVRQGVLPPDLPPDGTALVGGGGAGGIRELTIHTRKGAATIRFAPDREMARSGRGFPRLVAGPGRGGGASSARAWQLPIEAPVGRAGRLATYTIVFEFSERAIPAGESLPPG